MEGQRIRNEGKQLRIGHRPRGLHPLALGEDGRQLAREVLERNERRHDGGRDGDV